MSFAHISYVVLSIGKCWENVAHRTFCAHTDFKKFEGTLDKTYFRFCYSSTQQLAVNLA